MTKHLASTSLSPAASGTERDFPRYSACAAVACGIVNPFRFAKLNILATVGRLAQVFGPWQLGLRHWFERDVHTTKGKQTLVSGMLIFDGFVSA